MRNQFVDMFNAQGTISAADAPGLSRALNSYLFRGEAASVLPGVYCPVGEEATLENRLRALAGRNHLVVTRRAAAWATWWPEIEVDDVVVATRCVQKPHTGFDFEQRWIQSSHTCVRNRVTLTRPELTVLDLITDIGASAVDEALRRRAVTLPRLEAMLRETPGRRGNKLRKQILRDSRDQPWSALEREAHRLLRASKLRGWTTNQPVDVDATTYFIDIALPALRIGAEVDGFEAHGEREAFHYDRRRDALLAKKGWTMVRFSAQNVDTIADVLTQMARRRRASR